MSPVPIRMKSPVNFKFNPSTVTRLEVVETPTQLNLIVTNRYCDMDIKNYILNFYLEVTNGKLSFTIPVKYYEFVACSQTNKVVCDYFKVFDGQRKLNFVQIASFDKPVISIIPEVPNPLKEDCNILMEGYQHQYKDLATGTRVLSVSEMGIATGYTVANINNGSTYIRALTSLDMMTNFEKQKIYYRKIIINNELYITDLEARVWEKSYYLFD